MASGLVRLPGGSVELHDARQQRRWTVSVEPFELGVTPVTRHELEAILGPWPGPDVPMDAPAVEVSWLDALRYCNERSVGEGRTPCYRITGDDARWEPDADGYRLPTEAEWEFAARAGSSEPRYGELDAIAWYRANSEGRLQTVGRKEPNAFGLFDMLGNVWEWCWDRLDPERYLDYRVFRGGGWSDQGWSCRASVRRGSHPTFRIDDLGFRVARGG